MNLSFLLKKDLGKPPTGVEAVQIPWLRPGRSFCPLAGGPKEQCGEDRETPKEKVLDTLYLEVAYIMYIVPYTRTHKAPRFSNIIIILILHEKRLIKPPSPLNLGDDMSYYDRYVRGMRHYLLGCNLLSPAELM